MSSTAIRAVDLIERKRDGAELSDGELRALVEGYTAGSIPDYQMSAFLMAVVFRGLTPAETVSLTHAMIDSGDTLDLGDLGRPIVDKHSTGGVGDKTTLVVAPLVASLGVALPKLSGRGLGHTGGTIDKLESIPGFRTDLGLDELRRVTRDIGLAVAAPTVTLVPADRRMYALRDVTGTVPSRPLIVASIMSKKLAVRSDAVVLDVKVGEGGFFADEPAARAFAEASVTVGRGFGRPVRAVLTAMDQPLGLAIGNRVEVIEAIDTLRGGGPADLVEVCVAIAGRLLAAGLRLEDAEADRRVREQLACGGAWDTFVRWVAAQGGDVASVEGDGGLELASRRVTVAAAESGVVQHIHAQALGRLAMTLGAGRERKEDGIDPGAGILLAAKVGDAVESGQPLATLLTSEDADAGPWEAAVREAFVVGPGRPAPATVLGVV